jgi:hypothetical protein
MTMTRGNVWAARAGAARGCQLGLRCFAASVVLGCFISSVSNADDLKVYSPQEKGRSQSVLSEDADRSPFWGMTELRASPEIKDSLSTLPSARAGSFDFGLGQEPGGLSPNGTGRPSQPDSMGPLDLSKVTVPSTEPTPESAPVVSADASANKPRVPMYATLPVKIALLLLALTALCAAPIVWAAARRYRQQEQSSQHSGMHYPEVPEPFLPDGDQKVA